MPVMDSITSPTEYFMYYWHVGIIIEVEILDERDIEKWNMNFKFVIDKY